MTYALLLMAAVSAGAPAAAPQDMLLDFNATWCGPCRQMSPIVDKLHREGFPVYKIDADQRKDLMTRYNVTGLPTFVMIVGGQEVQRSVGATSEASLRQMLAMIPPAQPAASANPVPPTHVAPAQPQLQSDLRAEPTRVASAEPAWAEQVAYTAPAATPPRRKGLLGLSWGRRAAPSAPALPATTTRPITTAVRAQSPEAPVAGTARDPMQSSVRIRVRDEHGVNLGSGTLIACKDDKSLILSCAHIFRGFTAASKVEIDLFPNGPAGKPLTVAGKLLARDEPGDVSLIGVIGSGVMPVSTIADAAHGPAKGQHVFSVGCGNGELPTKMQHPVTGINIYKGPDTIECDGMPIQGRSGGGLFDTSGNIVGVCIARMEEERRGVYAGLPVIHQLLGTAGYSYLVPQSAATQMAATDSVTPADDSFEAAIAAATGAATSSAAAAVTAPTQTADPSPFATLDAAAPAPFEPIQTASLPNSPPTAPRFNPASLGQDAALAAVAGGAEVTCIIRRPGAADGRGETIVINRASPKFLRYLRGELDAVPTETSAVLPPDEVLTTTPTPVVSPARCRPVWVTPCSGSRTARMQPARFIRSVSSCATSVQR